MLQSTKFIQTTHLSHKHTLNQTHNTPTNLCPPILKQPKSKFNNPNVPSKLNGEISIHNPVLKQCNNKITRRELTLFTNSSLLLLASQTLNPNAPSIVLAEETLTPPNESSSLCNDNEQTPTTGRAFLDISIDGEPVGRIIIGFYDKDAPLGTSRFSDLVSGKAGISFRRKEFTKIMPNYVQHGGVRSYGVDAEIAKRRGRDFSTNNVDEALLGEWERLNSNNNEGKSCEGKIKNVAGSVSFIVRDPSKPPPKMKLVARKGKLEIDEEEVGVGPNGTEFTIALKDSPELDSSGLVVGRVIEGMDVIERISKVKTVQENTSSPYFRVAKLIGDKRAVVAERGFNRPYSKVIITNCGLLE